MKAIEVKLSDIIIQNPQINSFPELIEAIRAMTSEHMLYLKDILHRIILTLSLMKCYPW